MKLVLKKTCGACPEQYDVFDENGKPVAYYRLRHGYFRVDVPDCGGETIYEANPSGDGIFDEDERDFYLDKANNKVRKYYKRKEKMKNKPKVDNKWLEEFEKVIHNAVHLGDDGNIYIEMEKIQKTLTQTQQDTLEWCEEEVETMPSIYIGDHPIGIVAGQYLNREQLIKTIKQRMEGK